MRKKLLLALVATTALNAHNLWVVGENSSTFSANMIYGHTFPTPEVIKKERVQLFNPVEVVGEGFKEVLTQKGENYHFEAKAPLKKGTYIVKATYKPTAWSQKEDGKWEMAKTRKDIKGKVKWCGISSFLAKSIVMVDDDGSFALKAFDKDYEITPLDKPSDIKVGKKVKFKLTLNGKPVKQHEVFGGIKGYSDNEMSFPFYAKTDLKGEFEFTPLKKGFWYLRSKLEEDSKNKDCEIRFYATSITFDVK